MLMEENMEEMDYQDSTTTKISDLLPKTSKRFRFQYEYDFGDSWYHEVLFEGLMRAESKVNYPFVWKFEGLPHRKDCGGFWGYRRTSWEAIQNPRQRAARGRCSNGWGAGSILKS